MSLGQESVAVSEPVAAPDEARLRIATMLQTDGPGGAETMVLRLSEQLRNEGHWVTPVTPAKGLGWLGEQYRRVGLDPEPVRIGHRWIDVRFLRDLIRVIRRNSIQVVHSHEFEMAVYGALAARIVGARHVFTMHGGLTVWKAWQRRVALRWAIRNSASAVVVSHATRKQFSTELRVPESSFEVIPNGVPVLAGDATAPRKEFACGGDEVIILAVGNLERNKGHRELLQALASLSASAMPSWRLVIAAGRGGPEHQFLLDYAREKGLASRVHIALGRTDIPDLQAMADVFVMPSLWEGMPMATLEAMVAGNPVIASNTGGIPEALEHGRQGILVPPGDVGALAAALRSLISDPQYRDALGKSARRRAMSDFTVQAMTARYEALYLRALGSLVPKL